MRMFISNKGVGALAATHKGKCKKGVYCIGAFSKLSGV